MRHRPSPKGSLIHRRARQGMGVHSKPLTWHNTTRGTAMYGHEWNLKAGDPRGSGGSNPSASAHVDQAERRSRCCRPRAA
jgi:hypothetical protein